MSMNIKVCKAQISKIIQSVGLSIMHEIRMLGDLGKKSVKKQ